jgi:hypothetical protein
MSDGTATIGTGVRKGFCERCDAPLYDGEPGCVYCGGGPSAADFQAVAVISMLVLSGIGLCWLLFG